MKLLRQYRLAGSLLVMLSITAFSIAELDFAMLFIGVMLAVLSWYVTEGPRGRTLPDWMSNSLTVLLLGYCAFDFVANGTIEGAMGSLGRFLLWLLVIKLFSRRTANEERQRFTLATMLVLTGCLESVEFVFGILVIAYAAVAVWTAMLWRLSQGAEDARQTRAAGRFAPPVEIAFGRRAVPHMRWLLGSALAAILAFSLVGFVLFPRIGTLRFGEGAVGSVTGFNDEIDLRGGDRITESRRELFTLRWMDADGNPTESRRPLLLRGAVLDSYDVEDQRWFVRRSNGGSLSTIRTTTDGRLVDLTRGVAGDAKSRFRARFEMRSLSSEVIFAPYAPVAVGTSDARTLSLDPNTLLLRDISVDQGGRPWAYELLIQPQPDSRVLEDLSMGARPRRWQPEQGFPVVGLDAIASGILDEVSRSANIPPRPTAEAPEQDVWTWNREVARAIASWMKSNFSYTTDLSAFGRIPGEDPIVSFLTRYRSGHCEYFASALCATLRSLGVDSRIVTGFIAMEYDEQGEQYIVRESNAHAWVEVRTGEHAWTAVDATPEESLFEIQERNRSFADRFRWMYSRIELLWNTSVVAYDSSAQLNFANKVQSGWREAISDRLDWLLARMRTIATSLSLGRAGGFWFAVIGVGASTAGLAVLIVAIRRRKLRGALQTARLPVSEQMRISRDAVFFVEALRVLDRAGLAKPEHLTPRAYADELSLRNPAAGALFGQLSEAYYSVRYGGAVPSKTEANAHLSLVLALRGALRQNSTSRAAD